jgi:hypothetical protein
MTIAQIKPALTKTHFYLLLFVLLNFAVRLRSDFSINYSIVFALKVIIYITGIILFFLNLRPFKKVALYFSFFIWTPVSIALLWIFHGIFLGILASIFMAPISPNDVQYEKGKIKVYEKFSGFLGTCCSYEITEQKFLLFEKSIWEINGEPIDFDNLDLKVENDSIKMKLDKVRYDTNQNQLIKYDTVMKLRIQ